MSEASFLLTLRNFSPLWRWSSLSTDSASAWTIVCAGTEDNYRCDDHTAQYTQAKVSANLTFYGTGLAVYGNATGGMGWTMSIDGQNTQTSTSVFSTELASWTGLSSGQHTLSVQTTPGASGSAMYLERADVTVGTGQTGKNTTTSYVDSLNSSVSYSSGDWHDYGGYPDTFQPPGVTNNNFTGSNVKGTTASLVFKDASAIVWYGPCYQQCGTYSVSLDSEAAVSYNGTWDTPRVVAESCVRYMRTDLDPTQQHAIQITVEEDKFVNVDYFQFFSATNASSSSGGGGGSGGSGGSGNSPSSGHHSSSNVGAIAGGVVGGLGALVIAAIVFLFWRRKRRAEAAAATVRPTPVATDSMNEKPDLESGHTPDPLAPFPPSSHWSETGAAAAGQHSGSSPTSDGRRTADFLDLSPVSPRSEDSPLSPAPVPAPQPTPTTPFNAAAFSPTRVDYRPPEKADFSGSTASLTSSFRSRGAARSPRSRSGTTASNSARGDVVPPLPTSGGGHPDSISSYPLSMTDASSSSRQRRRGGSGRGSSANHDTPPAPPATTLSQISHDVNRILTTLGRLRITPGETVHDEEIEDVLPAPIHGLGHGHGSPEVDDGTSPPEYGEHEPISPHTGSVPGSQPEHGSAPHSGSG